MNEVIQFRRPSAEEEHPDGFTVWMRKVNSEIMVLTHHNLGRDDIDDWSYREDYLNGYGPDKSARRALRNAGWEPNA